MRGKKKEIKGINLTFNLEQCRKIKGITKKDMASRLNMSHPTYTRLENNQSDITIKQFTKIVYEFELSPVELLSIDFDNKEMVLIEKSELLELLENNIEKIQKDG